VIGPVPIELEVTVLGAPVPQGSKSFKGIHGGRPVLAESSRGLPAWRQTVSFWASQHRQPPLEGPVRVEMVFTLSRPKSAPKRRRLPDRMPDLSKLARAVEDSLTDAGVWHDDAQVVEEHLWKRYVGDPLALDRPGVVVRVVAAE
jgi:crossover junction endodeoxyribonuclease RusA